MSFRRLPACVLLAIALAGVALAAAPPAAQSPEPQGPTITQAEEQLRTLRAALKDRATAAPETWGALMLMMSEMVLLNLRAQKAAGGAAAGC